QLVAGNNSIKVTTDYDCQGKYSENIFISEDIMAFPNPTKGNFQLYINGKDASINYAIFDVKGRQIQASKSQLTSSRIVDINLSKFTNGIYYVEIQGETVNKSIKIVKTK
ncbi:T9SS type A sorting domain-containing protein, partial [Polaribacter sp.]|uniref:T9SS type A sorting domain-containing protein n=1 Tax=Polaribacter sp. TaxID=1920175 RepID=UPI003F6D94CB